MKENDEFINKAELKRRLKHSAIFNCLYPKWVDSVIDGMPIENIGKEKERCSDYEKCACVD